MDTVGSILFSSPPLMVVCIVAALLHVIEFFVGARRWTSAVNLACHLGAIFVALYLGATLLDVLILLMLSAAVCLGLRLIRRKDQ